MNKQSGFTVIELMIVLAIVAILIVSAASIISVIRGSQDTEQMAIEQTMKKFPSGMRQQVEITDATCDNWDTDRNGRVRCTVNYMRAGNTDLNAISSDTWDCPWGLTFASSCVPLKYGNGFR